MFSIKNFTLYIALLAFLQVLCSTFFLYVPKVYAVNSFVFLLCGVGISVLVLRMPPLQLYPGKMLSVQLVLKLIFIALLTPFSYQIARHIMDQTPLQIEYADMLPIIKTMCRRFLNGQWREVYQPIQEIWNGIQPIYLPGMWLPFSAALLFDFDLRWITVCGIWLSVILCVLPNWKKDWRPVILIMAILTLLSWFHFDQGNNVIRLTEEGVVFFYFSLLTVAIISFNPWLLGLSAALCFLSRYSLIGWIPFGVMFLVMTRQYSFLIKTIAAAVLVILVILILPFGMAPLLFHLHFQQNYILQATRVWNENPEIYYHSLGMAKFFGPHHIRLLHFILTIGTFLVPVGFFFVIRNKKFAPSSVLLAGLELSITFFYNFLDVSYLYLFYTPVFVSLVIAGWSVAGHPTRSTSVNALQ